MIIFSIALKAGKQYPEMKFLFVFIPPNKNPVLFFEVQYMKYPDMLGNTDKKS